MIDSVLQGLTQLRAQSAAPLSQGLSPENARRCLNSAIDAIHRDSLETALAGANARSKRVTLVVAYGVFTSPIEWVCLLLAAGCAVHLKAPSRDPALCVALGDAMAAQELPITVSTNRDLGAPDHVIAMGDDPTMAEIQAQTPHATHALYGHRFSVALVTRTPEHAGPLVAQDATRYDGRGCMAPTAVFTTGDPLPLAAAIARALAEAEQRFPRGPVDPALGPLWRSRLGLARVLGTVHATEKWAVGVLPVAHFQPLSLPRLVIVHGIRDVGELDRVLAPWQHQLSTLGTDSPTTTLAGFHRVAPLGQMQTPPFPRDHDGRPMLGEWAGVGV